MKRKTKKNNSVQRACKKRAELTSRIEQYIYDYVCDNFGEGEAEDPSWYIPALSFYIAESLLSTDYRAKHEIHYEYENE